MVDRQPAAMLSAMGQKAPSFRPAGLAPDPARPSAFVEGLARRLGALCAETGLSAETASVADRVLRDLIVPWSRVEAFARHPHLGWVSEISDDNTPIEFSVTLSPAGSEVRVLFEPQGEDQSLAGHREAALRFHDHLTREHGADLRRFEMVSDLFTPVGMRGPFALWSAVVFADGKPPAFKAYFNPQAQGVGSAVALVEEGLRRLGLPHAWRHLAATIARRGPHRDELKYFALDLSAGEQARVKVYVRHHGATPEDLEIAASAATDSTPGEAQDFARAMGGHTRRFKERAAFTCAAFVGGRDDRPSATTQYVPVCAYALDDLEVERRVAQYLQTHGMDSGPYCRLLAAFANRPLSAGVGLQSWVAFRRYQGVPRLTIYLACEVRHVFPPGSVPASTENHMSFDSAEEILACVDQYGLDRHPLIRHLERAANERKLVCLLANNASELLSTARSSAARLDRWKDENVVVGESFIPEQTSSRHLFRNALRTFRTSPDRVEAAAAELAAARVTKRLVEALVQMLKADCSIGLSLRALVRDGKAAEAEQLSRLDAAGTVGLPSVLRGALGVHRALWSALDQLADGEWKQSWSLEQHARCLGQSPCSNALPRAIGQMAESSHLAEARVPVPKRVAGLAAKIADQSERQEHQRHARHRDVGLGIDPTLARRGHAGRR
jgi:DMATS type aromatic prenyltransferase